MIRFDYARATDPVQAAQLAAGALAGADGDIAAVRFLAGGTNLVDLLKEDVERPRTVIDITRLPLADIIENADGGITLGALATNADTARHPLVRERYPLLASAILAGASPQLRNAATNGGNLNQRTRCYYFYDTAAACNKRAPGSGCGAIGGVTRIHAILGASDACIATHPSDMCVALAALDARVRVQGAQGERTIAFADYHRLPGDEPWRDNTLAAGELVTAIELPPATGGVHHTYIKLRDRLSYAFALVSVAVLMQLDEADNIGSASVALGGVAHKPWRVPEAEAMLAGAAPSDALFDAVATRMLAGAVGQGGNDFKVTLAQRAIKRALRQAYEGRPQSHTDKRIA
jgi:xanthine dehydrogenase YagS FAD-binding subunit